MRGSIRVGRCRLSVVFALSSSLLLAAAGANAANRAPSISGTPPTWFYTGSTYNFKPKASDPERAKLRYAIENKPAWASFSTTTGHLSGTSKSVGLWTNIRISVSDGYNTVSLPAFSIRATSRSNVAPTISGSPLTSITAGQAYSFQPSAKDANGDPLVFRISNKPGWTSFSTTSGHLSGTPSAAHVGTYSNIVISVTDGSKTATLPAFSITVKSSAPANQAPKISGTPPTSVNAGNAYSFRPSASDAEGDTLAFSISNRPSWASFSTVTGQLSGTPSAMHVGTYSSIVISVSDGKASSALPAFSIAVVAVSNGAATLSWMPPTQNTDGSPLTNLAGYRIYYGNAPSQLAHTIQVANPGVTAYVLDDLAPGTYYFAVRAYTSAGTESDSSNIASKVVH